jgi:hypothetical protein
MNIKRRTETFTTNFVNRKVEGWAFAVGDCFRMQLDIQLDARMDLQANTEKKLVLGRPLKTSEKTQRSVWTQGVPPAYSFDRGHVFHEVNESKEGMRRSLVVLLARPDPDALTEAKDPDDFAEETTPPPTIEETSSSEGFVDYEVLTYLHGNLVLTQSGFPIKERFSCTQSMFAELLLRAVLVE